MIALLSAEAEETGQQGRQGTVAPSVHTLHYYKER